MTIPHIVYIPVPLQDAVSELS